VEKSLRRCPKFHRESDLSRPTELTVKKVHGRAEVGTKPARFEPTEIWKMCESDCQPERNDIDWEFHLELSAPDSRENGQRAPLEK
jgi:hypothetical protein